ncbi:hypothetical protein RMSM_05029 [Rhodopirellula maiorica SM1]|uniref:Uncharacterized protein n=1 Tax=Rhodopirellula maiorica SM1 TaxID=1265738 RepID=M5RFA0_9BACT|nr:hypothetical protein RMSM_05029 [Rhodopirellula maiorica SM1]
MSRDARAAGSVALPEALRPTAHQCNLYFVSIDKPAMSFATKCFKAMVQTASRIC